MVKGVRGVRAHRVMVQLDNAAHEDLIRVATVCGLSFSKVLSETWQMSAPALLQLADIVEQAEKAKLDVREKVLRKVEGSLAQMSPKATALMHDLDILSESLRGMTEGCSRGVERGPERVHIT